MATTSTLTPESVLAAARSRHSVAVKAELDILQLAVDWAALNPGEDRDRHGLLGHAAAGAGRRGCADDR